MDYLYTVRYYSKIDKSYQTSLLNNIYPSLGGTRSEFILSDREKQDKIPY